MAETVVHVILTGIVSLVYRSPGRYLIRLQDARTSHHAHFPSIVVEKDRLVSTNMGDPDAAKPKPPGEPRYVAYKIDNGPVQITGSPSGGVNTTGLLDVVRISDACLPARECGVIKKTFAGVEVEVDGGFLHTAGLEPYRWRFSNEPAVRRIAEEVCWTFEIAPATLLLTFPGGKTMSVDAPPNGDIEVRLQNVPEDELIPTPQTGPPTGPDPHFPLYFELSKTPPSPAVDLMPEQPPQPLAVHASHRLAGRRIVRSLPPDAPSRAATSGSGHGAHTHSGGEEELDERTARAALDIVRVNCPPALWDSLEP